MRRTGCRRPGGRTVTASDRKICPENAGDPVFQVEWELFAILISIAVWKDELVDD